MPWWVLAVLKALKLNRLAEPLGNGTKVFIKFLDIGLKLPVPIFPKLGFVAQVGVLAVPGQLKMAPLPPNQGVPAGCKTPSSPTMGRGVVLPGPFLRA